MRIPISHTRTHKHACGRSSHKGSKFGDEGKGKFGAYTSTNRDTKPSDSPSYREMKVYFVVAERTPPTAADLQAMRHG